MIKTIVTGGNGFIGSHLIKKLPHAVHLPHEEIDAWTSNAEQIFFLSTYGNMANHTDRAEMLKANFLDVLSMLREFDGWICYMSSSSVLLPVQTPYSRTKRIGEEIIQSLSGLKFCIVRPYSVTGVGEQKEHLIPTLIRSCMEGVPMDFDASPVHDFIDVEDVVDGLIDLAKNQATGIHEFGRCMPYSNDDVKELVEEATGRKANIQSHMPLRSYDNQDWFCESPSEYFISSKHLMDSIEEMVEAYKNELSRKKSD